MIGQDVPLPNLVVHYRVNSRLPGNAAMQGRDLTYVLPPQTVRVAVAGAADATDIRDASGASFGRVESLGAPRRRVRDRRRSRSSRSAR